MKSRLFKRLVVCAALLAGVSSNMASDWPQYRGTGTDGVSSERILTTWPADGAKRLWTVKTPAGFSSFSVLNGKAFTVVSRYIGANLSEVCVAMDAESGKELWATPTGPAKYLGGADSGAEGNTGGDGPRSTPTANGDRVYVYSAHLALHCFDAATGKSVWKKDIAAEFNGRNIRWESAMSPVVDGELLYVAGGGAGQSILAFNKATGAPVWKTGDETMTQATPAVATIQGVRQVIFLMQSGLVSLEATTGKPLWQFAFPFRTATACS